MNNKPSRRIWGPELLFIILLPVVMLIAIVITVRIAQVQGYTEDPSLKLNRFGQTIEPQ